MTLVAPTESPDFPSRISTLSTPPINVLGKVKSRSLAQTLSMGRGITAEAKGDLILFEQKAYAQNFKDI